MEWKNAGVPFMNGLKSLEIHWPLSVWLDLPRYPGTFGDFGWDPEVPALPRYFRQKKTPFLSLS